MSLSFNQCVVQFVKRDCNVAAHLLAQYGACLDGVVNVANLPLIYP
jgi:hypothetical protein